MSKSRSAPAKSTISSNFLVISRFVPRPALEPALGPAGEIGRPGPHRAQHLSAGIEIRPGELLAAVRERVTWYARARNRWIELNPDIKGGTPVVKGTRISVYSIHGRIGHGDTIEDVLEDNPDLPRDAIEAALAYARANPLVGRPGGRPWQA